jgi:hypothetical protein
MNKITTTAGMVALTAASVQAQNIAPMAGSQEATKPWSISASLRGFYDDNYATAPDWKEQDSWGFEISPSASLNLIRDQTALGLNYVYSMRWFEDRDQSGMSSADHAHQVNAKLSHAFTPRFKLDLSDSFVYAQEPELVASDRGLIEGFLRGDGDVIRNHAQGSFSAGITENLTAVIGYGNEYYDYDDEGLNSRSALLDRMEHRGSVNLRAVVLPKTVVVGGYQYEVVDYTSDDPIGINADVDPGPGLLIGLYDPEERNSTSHYIYAGVDQGITPTLNASLRGGVQYTSYDDLDQIERLNPDVDDNSWGPYVDANATWVYAPGSYAQLGVRHQLAQSDVGFITTGSNPFSPNLDAESTSVYGSVSHRIFGAFIASAVASYQHSTYDIDGGEEHSDDYFLAGINLTYEINRFLALEAGYNFDYLDSDLDSDAVQDFRSFKRNRVYVGIRGTY